MGECLERGEQERTISTGFGGLGLRQKTRRQRLLRTEKKFETFGREAMFERTVRCLASSCGASSDVWLQILLRQT